MFDYLLKKNLKMYGLAYIGNYKNVAECIIYTVNRFESWLRKICTVLPTLCVKKNTL